MQTLVKLSLEMRALITARNMVYGKYKIMILSKKTLHCRIMINLRNHYQWWYHLSHYQIWRTQCYVFMHYHWVKITILLEVYCHLFVVHVPCICQAIVSELYLRINMTKKYFLPHGELTVVPSTQKWNVLNQIPPLKQRSSLVHSI